MIRIGKGTIATLAKSIPKRTSGVYIICDEKLSVLRKKTLKVLKYLKIPVHEIPVGAGESLKDIEEVYPLYGKLLKAGADRNAVVVALGGGTVGDVSGFVAATYLRGVAWIGIPTTLLAQVDSSVGGKTGINHKKGKNLIGAFHQPHLVICDTDCFKTLGPREMISGLGEIIKYSLTYDPRFFSWLETNFKSLLKKSPDHLTIAVKKSLAWKSKVVAKDELDRTGVREVLNFGHTFGHALETLTDYEFYQHGEAVLWGMRFALALSFEKKTLKQVPYERMMNLLLKIPLPPLPAELSRQAIFEAMKKDKKSVSGKLKFVLLKGIGSATSRQEVTRAELEAAFDSMIEYKEKKNVR